MFRRFAAPLGPPVALRAPEDDERRKGLTRSANPSPHPPLRLHPVDARARPPYRCRMGTHRTFIATYIMASGRNGTIYIGSTANLFSRVWKHKTRVFPGFTDDNDCTNLVWFEPHVWMTAAIRRERRLKKWLRDWKLKLIEDANPQWLDLAADWFPENDPDWTPPVEPD